LPSHAELQTQYDEIKKILVPLEDSEAIKILVTIADDSGIDIREDAGKFQVPAAAYKSEKIGQDTYQVMEFAKVLVQGTYDDVMHFIYSVQSGTYLQTMVLGRISINEVDVAFTGDEAERRLEFSQVANAVKAMMLDNNLALIPNPMNFAGGTATNLMGDDPETEGIEEGFPDITTTALERGYTSNETLRNGYVLYEHVKINSENTTDYTVVSYFDRLGTEYYYTCEADGTVRQWSGSDPIEATEYLGREPSVIETRAIIDIKIYSKTFN
jgi:hypothetical protein